MKKKIWGGWGGGRGLEIISIRELKTQNFMAQILQSSRKHSQTSAVAFLSAFRKILLVTFDNLNIFNLYIFISLKSS